MASNFERTMRAVRRERHVAWMSSSLPCHDADTPCGDVSGGGSGGGGGGGGDDAVALADHAGARRRYLKAVARVSVAAFRGESGAITDAVRRVQDWEYAVSAAVDDIHGNDCAHACPHPHPPCPHRDHGPAALAFLTSRRPPGRTDRGVVRHIMAEWDTRVLCAQQHP